MHIIFFILSIVLLSYSHEQPSCAFGSVIFAILGFLLLHEKSNQKIKEESKQE
jgi:positive regulator of sigma E activity